MTVGFRLSVGYQSTLLAARVRITASASTKGSASLMVNPELDCVSSAGDAGLASIAPEPSDVAAAFQGAAHCDSGQLVRYGSTPAVTTNGSTDNSASDC